MSAPDVFVVMIGGHDGTSLVGVFSDKEKAIDEAMAAASREGERAWSVQRATLNVTGDVAWVKFSG